MTKIAVRSTAPSVGTKEFCCIWLLSLCLYGEVGVQFRHWANDKAQGTVCWNVEWIVPSSAPAQLSFSVFVVWFGGWNGPIVSWSWLP